MSKRRMGLIGPIIQDTYNHQCNGECKGAIHMIEQTFVFSHHSSEFHPRFRELQNQAPRKTRHG
jgi:hypothetical protein